MRLEIFRPLNLTKSILFRPLFCLDFRISYVVRDKREYYYLHGILTLRKLETVHQNFRVQWGPRCMAGFYHPVDYMTEALDQCSTMTKKTLFVSVVRLPLVVVPMFNGKN